MEANQLRPIVSDREDGRFLHTDLFLRQYYKTYRPKLAYDPSMSMEEYQIWKAKVIEKLREVLKMPTDVPPQPAPKMLWSEPRDGYRLEKWEAYPEPYSVVPFLMLIPNGADREHPVPTMMCYPGTWHPKEALAGEESPYDPTPLRYPENNAMAKRFVEQGYAAVVVEHPGFGELKPTGDGSVAEKFSIQMLILGRNYQGFSTFQKIHILDWVKTLDFVDKNNIYASGHSLGKIPSLFMGLLCDEIKGIIYNNDIYDQRIRLFAGPTTYLWHNCCTHLIPNFEEWFTFPDLLAAYAPKPLLITEGGVTADIEKIKSAYALHNCPDDFEYHYFPKYEKEENRPYDHQPTPECLDWDDYYAYCNVVTEEHYFKDFMAIPWLKKYCK